MFGQTSTCCGMFLSYRHRETFLKWTRSWGVKSYLRLYNIISYKHLSLLPIVLDGIYVYYLIRPKTRPIIGIIQSLREWTMPLTRKTYQQWYSLVVYQNWQPSLWRLQFPWRYVMVIGVDHNICSREQWPPKGRLPILASCWDCHHRWVFLWRPPTLCMHRAQTLPCAPSLLLPAKNVCRPYRDTMRYESAMLGTENIIPAISSKSPFLERLASYSYYVQPATPGTGSRT